VLRHDHSCHSACKLALASRCVKGPRLCLPHDRVLCAIVPRHCRIAQTHTCPVWLRSAADALQLTLSLT
jgi:hypothetical protein